MDKYLNKTDLSYLKSKLDSKYEDKHYFVEVDIDQTNLTSEQLAFISEHYGCGVLLYDMVGGAFVNRVDIAYLEFVGAIGSTGEKDYSGISIDATHSYALKIYLDGRLHLTSKEFVDKNYVDNHHDDTKENISNKITSFVSPTNEQYPSAKLTKDTIDNLKAYVDGNTYKYVDSESVNYEKQVPKGAKRYAILDMIGGDSKVANQFFNQPSTFTQLGLTMTYDSNHILHINGTSESSYAGFGSGATSLKIDKNGHKYLTSIQLLKNSDNISFEFAYLNSRIVPSALQISTSNTINSIGVCNSSAGQYIGIRSFATGTTFNDVQLKIGIVDLTQWFGAGNEPSSTDDLRMNEVYAYLENHPEYNEGQVINADVKNIKVEGEETYDNPIPTAIQQLDCYGAGINGVYNYVDYVNKKYHKRIGKVDLGTLNYGKLRTKTFYTDISNLPSLPKKPPTTADIANIICSKYVADNTYYTNLEEHDKVIAITTTNYVMAIDGSYTDATAFKTAMSGVYLYYELAEEQIIDISDILDSVTFLNVESEGTMTFEQTHQLNVPNKETFEVKLSEALE